MSRLVARILLSIFVFPLAAIFYIMVLFVGMEVVRRNFGYRRTDEAIIFGTCGLLTWMLVAAYWCLLWRSSIRWNAKRITFTSLAAFIALLLGGIIGFYGAAFVRGGDGIGFGAFIAGVVAIILWLIATVFIWRETAAERAQRIAASSGSAIACPTCGYNLTGLREARCPECGTQFTLDELIASLPNNKVEID